MGDEVVILPADKHNSFPQDDSITLSVRNQINKFAISQGKREG